MVYDNDNNDNGNNNNNNDNNNNNKIIKIIIALKQKRKQLCLLVTDKQFDIFIISLEKRNFTYLATHVHSTFTTAPLSLSR